MTKNPSRKQSEAFILIIPPVIRMQVCEWGVVVVVCRSTTPRGMRAISPQVIQLRLGDWEAAAV